MKPNYKNGLYRKTITYQGKRYYITAKDEISLMQKVTEKRYALERGDIVVNKNTTVERWANQWLDTDKKSRVKESTFREIERLINNTIIPAIGSLRLCDVSRINLQQLLNSKAGMSFSHVSKIKIYLCEIFDAAERDGLIERNPSRFLQLPECSKGTARAMTDDEYAKTIEICAKFDQLGIKYKRKTPELEAYMRRAGIWIMLMLRCGLRRGETIPLTWADIDFKNHSLSIQKSVEFIDGKPRVNSSAKTAAGNRVLLIPDDVFSMLEFEKKQTTSVLVFPNNTDGGMLNEWHVSDMWHTFYRLLDISLGATVYRNRIVESKIADNLRIHSLRHTCITHLIMDGANIKDVQAFAGHADVQTTLNIYTHVEKEAAAQRIYKLQCGTDCGTKSKNA